MVFATCVAAAVAAPPRWDIVEQAATIDIAALQAVKSAGERIELPGWDRARRGFAVERILPGADGARTLVGFDAARGAIAYVTLTDAATYAVIRDEQQALTLQATPDGVAVLRDDSRFRLAPEVLQLNDARIPPVLGPRVTDIEATQVPDGAKAMPTPQATIDLMLIYSASMQTRYGAGLLARLNNLVAQTNDAYLRSEVAITLQLVHTESTTYANSGSNDTALDDLTGGLGVFSSVPATRNAVGADLVALIRAYDRNTHAGCGVAWIGGSQLSAPQADYGYAAVSDGADVNGSGYFCFDFTLAHELGHNMGLMHDRAQVLANYGTIVYGATSYGFGYIIPATNPSVGDIMSYSQRPVTCFSSPNVYRQGPIVGVSGGTCNVTPASGDVLGIAQANPNSADAAAALNYTRAAIAAFRNPPAPPTISGTISNGVTPVSGVSFCARPSAGVSCTVSNASGAYSCTVPNGWSGVLHSPMVGGQRIPAQVFANVTGAVTRNVAATTGVPSCDLDVDDNGLFEAATDGLAILRRALGFGQASFAGLSGACAANTTAASIHGAANTSFNAGGYNVTGGGATLATTDALVIIRTLLGLSGNAVVDGLGLSSKPGVVRTSWNDVKTWMNSNCRAGL